MLDPTATRLRLVELGYEPTPDQGKQTFLRDWQSRRITEDDVRRWPAQFPAATNTGIRTTTTPSIDIDVLDPKVADAIERMVPPSCRRIGKPPKRLLLYRCDVPFASMATPKFKPYAGAPKEEWSQVEILATRKKFTAFGNHPDTGRGYEWNRSPLDTPRGTLPALTGEEAMGIIADAARTMTDAGWEPVGSATTGPAEHAGSPQAPLACFASAVAAIPNADETWDNWVRIGLAIFAASGGSEDGFAVFDAWSQRSVKYTAATTRSAWRGFKPKRIGGGTLVHLAKQHGWEMPEATQRLWFTAGYFAQRFSPSRAQRLFSKWCERNAQQAGGIFQAVLAKELA